MKQNDIAVIILVVAFSLIFSWVLGGALINSPDSRSKQVEVVEPIPDRFVNVAEDQYTDIYNDAAINPDVNIPVGEGDTPEPFIDSED